ncbi:hypothetical protein C8Q80DRAFT_325923 [Daedaleopsis nitida]|nr:hypothetical protein C8Q80DRAFT_325923 [Daedaleopsis nitida]
MLISYQRSFPTVDPKTNSSVFTVYIYVQTPGEGGRLQPPCELVLLPSLSSRHPVCIPMLERPTVFGEWTHPQRRLLDIVIAIGSAGSHLVPVSTSTSTSDLRSTVHPIHRHIARLALSHALSPHRLPHNKATFWTGLDVAGRRALISVHMYDPELIRLHRARARRAAGDVAQAFAMHHA